jgi:para-aminobenzoate synthetase/4-amino-4-deoxychorismate lyase
VNDAVLIHDPALGRWLAFERPLRILTTSRPEEVLPLLREVEEAVNGEKLYAAGFLSYEAAPAFDPALTVRPDPSGFPLLWFGLYHEPASWNPRDPVPLSSDPPLHWTPSLSRDDYDQVIARIRNYLYSGETYQVNYTFRLTTPFRQEPLPLFETLVQAQGAHYSAFIDTADFAICSASPELFFRLNGTQLESRPMKGTVKRGVTTREDQANAQGLRDSPKNQSENVMIVDMVRNDMGRVAEKGQVRVDQLFKVERYPTVWQMVSTVSARTRASLCDIFSALFPCASITGAPKPRTMALITREEQTPRRIYTGTIGYMAPDRQAQFNVAIRTVLIDKTQGVAEYGVGGGIVWDSVSGDEYDECGTKAKVLCDPPVTFQLLETLLWTPGEGIFLKDRHLARLEDSANYFGFTLSMSTLRSQLDALTLAGPASSLLKNTNPFQDGSAGTPRPTETCEISQGRAKPPAEPEVFRQAFRIRLLVSRSGTVTLESSPFEPAPTTRPVPLRLARHPVDITDRFLYHKTTCRQVYEAAREGVPDGDEVLLWNAAGELTESTIANLVVELDGERLTPPVSCGLLAGTFRAELLAQGAIKEAVIRLSDLPRIRAFHLINSLRKWREARWLTAS